MKFFHYHTFMILIFQFFLLWGIDNLKSCAIILKVIEVTTITSSDKKMVKSLKNRQNERKNHEKIT